MTPSPLGRPVGSEEDVNVFKQFLRIQTVHPNPDLKACVQWLTAIGKELGLVQQVITFKEHMPIVVLSRLGKDPSLPTIGLSCHMDVVPVVAERWTKLPPGETPFSAFEDADGKIYARGAQDMKCVGAQYLCALRRLASKPLLRTVHTIWAPDEEIGGEDGMRAFVTSPEFRRLNLACMLDEGLAFPENKYVIFTGERTSIWIKLAAEGPVGHGAKLIPNTAVDRLSKAIARLTQLRDANVKRLESNTALTTGDVTTCNITVVQAGVSSDGGKSFAQNVIPSEAYLLADIRVSLEDYPSVIAELKSIVSDLNLSISFTNEFDERHGPSPYTDRNSLWLKLLEQSIHQVVPDAAVERAIFPAATDSRYVRRAGVPAFGFSPMRRTPSLLHDHNEYLERSVYLEGVDVYAAVIETLSNTAQSHL